MNKPRALREGFIEDDRPDDPFEREDKKPKVTETEPESPAPPKADEDEWPIVIKLQKPIPGENHSTITELRMREPSTNDIMQAGGNPCRVEIKNAGTLNAEANIIIDDLRMYRLIVNLSGVLEPFMRKLDPRDYNSAAYRLRRFFIPEGRHLW